MALKIGIVGLPNVGKSTLFAALTKKQVPMENYPFCTIDPNVGVTQVPDARLAKLAELSKSKKIVPTVIEFVDIAGLVKGAHKGEGLGNQFLSHIREVDALAHVVRDFANDDIIHVDGSIDAIRDIETINLELIIADYSSVSKRIEDTKGSANTGEKEAKELLLVFEKVAAKLKNNEPARSARLDDRENKLIKDLNLLTLKPALYVINKNESDNISQKLTSYLKNEESISLNIKEEIEVSQLSSEDKKELEVMSGLDKLIVSSYRLLNLITYLTTGPEETRAWTVRAGSLAPQAAGAIHTDFEKGFIRAEVIHWEKLLELGSWNTARNKGLIRVEGKKYEIKDGDVIYFRTA